MSCGLTRFLLKISHWFHMRKYRYECHGFCPFCKWFDECFVITLDIEEITGEPIE